MEKNDNKRQIARTLFVQGGMTQKEIASKLEVTEQTISRWSKKDHWDELKKNVMSGKQEILRSLYTELQKLQNIIEAQGGVADSKQADIRRKLITDIRQLETRYSVSQTVQIGMDFCEFLKEIDFELAGKISKYYQSFIDEQIEKQKWQKESESPVIENILSCFVSIATISRTLHQSIHTRHQHNDCAVWLCLKPIQKNGSSIISRTIVLLNMRSSIKQLRSDCYRMQSGLRSALGRVSWQRQHEL